ncbi:choice-of-anchor J domain-containing protein [Chryseobacterium sp. WG23]|uniref:T9SS-dependent choice-of-anchor J family protein n=1 Tax=Chryseobacterium sp. WG23 TaxID=2926910 RepID=UPI00211E1462|nr:choice-of-anchor J domain-containing protein [Chryseobacterium sp. WG23]MCQ9634402.1 choice-of-anchor J domain-containing protein [Chryseobacterium sp. WG23]
MKQIYQLLAMCCLIPLGMSAQYSQSFDSATMPADWTIINGGDSETWITANASSPSAFAPYSGTHFLGLKYGSTAHDDYAISPAILVVTGVSDKLSFWAKNKGASLAETIDIKISTTDPTAAAFTDTLAASVKPPTTWQQYTYDLTPYVGQTIYIAFYSSTTNIWYIGIDDFEISTNNLGISEVNLNKASIYPNPVKDVLNISNKNKMSEVGIYDFTGKLLKKETVNSENARLYVNDLATGNYILKIKEGVAEKSYKIIKK